MLHNITIDYFHSQLFWFFISFFLIYFSFSFFLYPAIERVFLLRSKTLHDINQDIFELQNFIKENQLRLEETKIKSQKTIADLRAKCIKEMDEITTKYKLEYNKQQLELEQQMLVKVNNFVNSDDYNKMVDLVVKNIKLLIKDKA